MTFLLAASLLFSDVREGESPSTRDLRRSAFSLIRQKKYVEALPDLTAAADKGDRLALYQLGVFYEVGKEVPQDYQKAWECYSSAADKGLLAANHKLGLCHFYGWYVEKSEEKAMQYWLKGAEKGFAPSLYLCGTTRLSFLSKETTPENVQAIHWLLKAARSGLPEAVCLLGVLYETGFGVKKDLRLARALEERGLAAKFEIEPDMKSTCQKVLDRVNRKLSESPKTDS